MMLRIDQFQDGALFQFAGSWLVKEGDGARPVEASASFIDPQMAVEKMGIPLEDVLCPA